ncbi:DNA replication factor Cdt1 [Planococcus citri]|uniref:DNA replication factor Cdt1 n=1 Tax=Planococcus citri TaxID=170843 RepID=UPI0031F8315D
MQTNIDTFFKARKRPATDELPGFPSKLVARKLFDGDSAADNVCTQRNEETERTDNNESQREKTPPPNPESTPESDRPTTPTQSPATQESLRRKLHLGEFKNVIRQHKKYSTLKKKLEKYNATASRLKKIEDSLTGPGTAELKKFDKVELEVPSSPVKCGTLKPKRLFWTSPIRSPVKDLPYVSPKKLLNEGPKQTTPVKPAAFERYNHLLASGKDALILPHKYLVLKEVFRSVDIITKIKTDRGEMITFDKLKRDVQKMLSRNFEESRLGQIKAVYPESYEFSRERVKVACSTEERYQLVINRLSHTVKKDDDSEPIELTNSERLKIFHERLLIKTKTYHQEFLSKLDPPIVVESDKLKQWHAEFELDNVPDVVPEPLPQPPVQYEVFTAKSVLARAHDLTSVNKRMERAVSAVAAEENKETKVSEPSTPSTPTSTADIPRLKKALKNVPKSLLEKIRAKQAAKAAETMTQTPAEAKEAIMLSRLPELARIMRNVFVNEKKGILPVEVVMLKIGHSYREKLVQNDLMQHMQLISKHVPGWMNFCTVRNASYIRLSKDADMTRVIGKLQKLANPS